MSLSILSSDSWTIDGFGSLDSFILSGFISNGVTGDYKCTRCGTYLETPDNLD
ncbi:hypothetical protein [Vibrio sp. HI00D65]|uniref:hypothetical protein n=1 Tax=Vibrio sp. HI00D65 TaxID=1822216 RepID=UPI0012F9F29E|nr:hypothetical protein [Vibrio sp. HI00D65]